LFLVTGLLSLAALLLERPTLRTAFLLAVAVKYVDPSFKFAGLYSFVVYLLLRRGGSS